MSRCSASYGRACRRRRRELALKTLYAKNRDEWRTWLEKNAARSAEIWLISYKKHTGKPSVPYDDAVEEALCYGWVDSIVKSIDDEKYAQKFTPRTSSSKWSASNIERVNNLIAAGKMTPAGLAAFEGHESRTIEPAPTTLPSELEAAFKSHKTAWKNFNAFPPGYRRVVIAWVASAKRLQTRRKRLDTLIEVSERNERIRFV